MSVSLESTSIDKCLNRMGDVSAIELNYTREFVNAKDVYGSIGMGFAKNNAFSDTNVEFLMGKLDGILARGSLR